MKADWFCVIRKTTYLNIWIYGIYSKLRFVPEKNRADKLKEDLEKLTVDQQIL